MKGLNRVELIGHLGKAPMVTNFDNGGKKAEFTLATSDGYKGEDGNWVDVTDWHNCFVTGRLADTVEKYFEKGTKVFVEGKLKHRSYDDKDGIKRYVTEVRVVDFMFLRPKSEQEKAEDQKETQSTMEDDDLPF